MSYLTVITRQQAKDFLKVDDISTDNEIDRMIKAALSYIEKQTNYFVYQRNKTYTLQDGKVKVYDFPINGDVPEGFEREQKTLWSNYTTTGTETELTLDIGFESVDDIPSDLLEVAYEILDTLYYAPETGKTIRDLSTYSKGVIDSYRRFV